MKIYSPPLLGGVPNRPLCHRTTITLGPQTTRTPNPQMNRILNLRTNPIPSPRTNPTLNHRRIQGFPGSR